jgi:hypothetical protein
VYRDFCRQIFKGAKPEALPIEQPARNLKNRQDDTRQRAQAKRHLLRCVSSIIVESAGTATSSTGILGYRRHAMHRLMMKCSMPEKQAQIGTERNR